MKKENVYLLDNSSAERVSKIGIIDFGHNIGRCEVLIYNFEDEAVPHFHINGIDSDFTTNICIYNEAYYLHDVYESINRFGDYLTEDWVGDLTFPKLCNCEIKIKL